MAPLLRGRAEARASPRRTPPGCCGLDRASARPDRRRRGGLVDPLSDRELDVLRLLASELSGPEIARHLVVSLNTVRTHTKNIYAKLGVGSRRDGRPASRRARPAVAASRRAGPPRGSPHVVIRAPHVGSYLPEHERDRNLRDPHPGPSGRPRGPPGSTAWRSPPPTTAARSSVAAVADQAALHGLIQKVRDLGLPLLSVTNTRQVKHRQERRS